ncbi:MarR family winged helix-turn-helix transcriptional regulator [Cellulomonas pakistanensis]|uniref:MarR family transcriptional regulator n=1 Tax=Cellulomonas pakistanensis TaxID=992287 RepID=A0A919PCI6_9CELL|nr:MarR family transcriptional regulator [Cellulomonas pakistanensis]GIG37678.1 MarR family transcriptional regulator [Cellulomonas pakistanensis]
MTTPAATDPLAVEAQVCLAMSAASRALVAFYRPLLEPLGLTHPQYLAMLALWQHGDLTLKTLAGLLHLEPATASPLVRRLEALGLVSRARDGVDERALAIRLTDAGRAMRERAVGIPAAMAEGLRLDAGEVGRIREAAELLLAACESAGARRA